MIQARSFLGPGSRWVGWQEPEPGPGDFRRGMIGCPKAARGAFWMRPANLTKP
jgi:hypothetical protein